MQNLLPPRSCRAIVKNVAKVQAGAGFYNFVAAHAVAVIGYNFNFFRVYRLLQSLASRYRYQIYRQMLNKTSPVAALTYTPFVVVVPVCVFKGRLGTAFNHNMVSIGCKYFFPLGSRLV
jgi:hypothetical protein